MTAPTRPMIGRMVAVETLIVNVPHLGTLAVRAGSGGLCGAQTVVALRLGTLAAQKGSGSWWGVRTVVVLLRPGALAAQKGSGGWWGVRTVVVLLRLGALAAHGFRGGDRSLCLQPAWCAACGLLGDWLVVLGRVQGLSWVRGVGLWG